MFERVTITVPRDLRKRMRAVQEAVNWSAVATAAFEARLAEISAGREVQTMEDAVQRMRASRLAAAHEDYAAGIERGKEFVAQHADWQFCEGLRSTVKGWDDQRWKAVEREQTPFVWLLRRVDPKRFRLVSAARAFLVDHVGDYFPSSTQFFRGWCEGALSLFREIEARIMPSAARSVARRSYEV